VEFTWSSDLTSDISHCWSSLCRVETSSTEHFFTATLATLSSSRRASSRLLEGFGSRSMWSSASPGTSVGSRKAVLNRGVFHRLAVKSIRIKRTESLLNGSRQKGQAGARRGEVFSMMLLQQARQSTCPGWSCVDEKIFQWMDKILSSPQVIE
jgi:hypothetical protein